VLENLGSLYLEFINILRPVSIRIVFLTLHADRTALGPVTLEAIRCAYHDHKNRRWRVVREITGQCNATHARSLSDINLPSLVPTYTVRDRCATSNFIFTTLFYPYSDKSNCRPIL
jgi:hypothetical protein